MIEFNCGYCSGHLAFPDDAAGGEKACPHCGKTIKVPTGAVPGFPGGMAKPSAGDRPDIRSVPARTSGTPILPPAIRRMKRPPAEEINLCAFLKWFLLVAAFVAAAIRAFTGVRWYLEASKEVDVEVAALLWVFVDITWIVIAGIICYTVFACLARIVGGLYILQRKDE